MRDITRKVQADIAAYALAERCRPEIGFWLRMVLVTPGFQFVLARRVQEALHRVPLVGRVLRRLVWWSSCLTFGGEIAMAAEIEGGLYVPHPYGIVVGRSRIGANVSIMQNVTIGTKRIEDLAVPVIGRGTVLGAGCVVLGNVVVGRDCVVGANTVVLASMPDGSVAIGVPARLVARPGSAVLSRPVP